MQNTGKISSDPGGRKFNNLWFGPVIHGLAPDIFPKFQFNRTLSDPDLLDITLIMAFYGPGRIESPGGFRSSVYQCFDFLLW